MQVWKHFSLAPNISMNEISVNNSFCQKSQDLDKLVNMIKQKLVISSRTAKKNF